MPGRELPLGADIDVNDVWISAENVVRLLWCNFFYCHMHLAGALEYWNDGVLGDSEQHSITPFTQSSVLHPHNIVTRVDVQHLAGDSTAPVAAQVKRGFTH